MKTFVAAALITMFMVMTFSGCPASKETKKEEGAAAPELTMTVGSLNVGSFNRRIERKDVAALARVLKQERVEVLSVQSITRYPGLETRVDLVKELAAQADLRPAFGEMVNSGGKQTGNAIFSSYPIRSHVNVSFGPVRSAAFDAAVLAIIDGGVRDVWIGAIRLPAKQSADDAAACMRLVINELPTDDFPPLVLAGTLPEVVPQGRFSEFRVPTASSQAGKFWITKQAGISILGSHSAMTDFGPMTIVQVGLFRQKRSGENNP